VDYSFVLQSDLAAVGDLIEWDEETYSEDFFGVPETRVHVLE
jgi:hypothetical protein